ncbi:SDR family NAD(P)-dependent oxidoreductase [Pseudomonas oryzihabitans]|uniref:NAD(P)-dependent dehydrogenase (Short-subunit alcohol dehydrogenase family) n=1 Tax=Pseudomonas oryzihabitans TaxID=47885 RepID=A0AAJ2BRU6_9PSED|nr:SDR family oxidoreductase [Pseudomonas psychrotolerans]MDR6235282.1 NAD(P)-dependent dehydrogenase (short-subunit alcohol dehydrogenase family) [Pseudomonas psychrotolerans]MDR6355490.1 NAD(P)-dependent dehydrogenase (short-subunit alcohol dehydrogenase family) [Pseudomonas psychrotolerans]
MDVILITGASRGIGASTAHECARRGHAVVITYREQAAAAAREVSAIRAAGGQALALPLDLAATATFPTFAARLGEHLTREWAVERLAGLVNNAGLGFFEPLASVSEAQLDSLCQVHLKGPFFLTQALLPLLADGAAIVNLTSATTRVATAGVAPYAACKGGLEVLTRYMAKEFAERRIRVNAVSPGPVRTELGGGLSDDFAALLASQTALGRVGEPADIARVIATLLGPDGAWINGQSLEVAGGYFL